MKKPEFSKVICVFCGMMFFGTLVELPYLLYLGIDVSIFAAQQIISTATVLGCATAFYFNKTKLVNSVGIKKDLIKWQWEFKQSHNLTIEQYQELQNQTANVDMAIDGKIDGEISEAVNEDVAMQNYY